MPLHSFSDQLLSAMDIIIIRSVPCTYLYMMRIMKDTALENNEFKRSNAQLQNEVYRRRNQSDPSKVMDL